MADDQKKVIIDRANRMLQQSRTLRKVSDELLQESRDIRRSIGQQPGEGAVKSKSTSRKQGKRTSGRRKN